MENSQLTVADIQNIQYLLESACARGTWKAAEMSTVGAVYDKISAFLKQASQQLQAQPTETPQGE